MAAAANRSTKASLRGPAYVFSHNDDKSFGPTGLGALKTACASMGHALDNPKNY